KRVSRSRRRCWGCRARANRISSMSMKRLAGTLLTGVALVILAGAGLLAQSNQTADASKEWPTYGHDSGGMRFSPLTQITPANVGHLQVAWVYHMKPGGTVMLQPGAGGRGANSDPARTAAAAPGRGRGRGASGLASGETT